MALLLLLVAFLIPDALADRHRIGVFVGNNEGLAGDMPLIFAESDAEKMRDLFVAYGEIPARDASLLLGSTSRVLIHELERLSLRIRGLVSQGHEVELVFFYSGHGDDADLHLGPTRFAYDALRGGLERTGAQVRIAMIDACQSGGMVRRKGGARGPAVALAAPTVASMRGTAIITSSAASALSQESAEIGGGFFTHYLHTALSGGADRNRDGEVSLAEAYDYVHVETAFSTREAPEAQTPHGDFDLAGAGRIVLTRLEEANARIAFLGDLEGAFSVWDESRKRYVAEVDGARPITLAVRPGTFFVHRRMPGWVEEATVVVRRGETRSVLVEDFVVVTYESAASRGDLRRQIRRAKMPDLSMRFLAGVRGPAGAANVANDYLGPMVAGGFQARWLTRGTTYWSLDVMSGRGLHPLRVTGLAPIRTQLGTFSATIDSGICTRPALFRVGIGARAGAHVLTREFPDWEVERQSEASLMTGANTWVGVYRGRFSADLQYSLSWLVSSWDGQGFPAVADVMLALGYRF